MQKRIVHLENFIEATIWPIHCNYIVVRFKQSARLNIGKLEPLKISLTLSTVLSL